MNSNRRIYVCDLCDRSPLWRIQDSEPRQSCRVTARQVSFDGTFDNDSAMARVGLTLPGQLVSSGLISPLLRCTTTLDNHSAMTRVGLTLPGQQSKQKSKSSKQNLASIPFASTVVPNAQDNKHVTLNGDTSCSTQLTRSTNVLRSTIVPGFMACSPEHDKGFARDDHKPTFASDIVRKRPLA